VLSKVTVRVDIFILLAAITVAARAITVLQGPREAKNQRLDPDKWFNNVEIVASKRIGQETVHYVRNIYKYYTA
jgi:membrane-bound lytic murein transglycosylase MltF